MSRYIDADVFKTFLEKQIKETEVDMRNSCGDENYEMAVGARECALREALSELKRAPIEDVQEVKRGYWIKDGRYKACSVCKHEVSSRTLGAYYWKYCPYCGSKLDLEDK